MSKNQEFVCVVCGASVTRRKSYTFKSGRACKHHQEVRDSVELKKEIELAKQRSKGSRKGSRICDRMARAKEISEWGKSHCWICKSNGLLGSKFWDIILDVFGTEVTANTEALLKHERISGNKILIHLPHAGTGMFKKLDRRMTRAAVMTGHVVVCPQCAENHKLDPEFLISASANVDHDYLDQLDQEVVEKIEELINV